jgi:RES domain-containing protein
LSSWEAYATLSGYHLYRCTFAEALVLEAPQTLDVQDKAATRAYGDAWVVSQDSVVLGVPAVVAPESLNYLLNPNHPDFLAQVALEPLGPFAFNARVEALVRNANTGEHT